MEDFFEGANPMTQFPPASNSVGAEYWGSTRRWRAHRGGSLRWVVRRAAEHSTRAACAPQSINDILRLF